MVLSQPSKLRIRVRFSLPAPLFAIFLFLQSCHPVFAYEQIITNLEKYIPIVIDSELCAKRNTYDGFYRTHYNRIELCLENIKEHYQNYRQNEVIERTLWHEAVHLAQDCKAGIANRDLIAMNPNVEITDKVRNKYVLEDHAIEAEAWQHSHQSTLHLVERYCNK